MDARRLNSGYYFRLLLPLLFLQKASGCQNACPAVGLDDSNIIPDSSFTANSQLNDDEYAANKARFSSNHCWEPHGNKGANHYLQIDLGKVFVICALSTKGNAKPNTPEWTTEYKISTSSGGTLWITYSENNNSPKLFAGNTDKDTAVKNDLVIPVLAKLIRFTPTKYNVYKALRVEVYGIDGKVYQDPCCAVGLDDSNTIPDNSFTASSKLRDDYAASKARFSSDHCWEPKDNSNADDYLQIDLGKVFAICAVATKGNAKVPEWTKEYNISTSSDGNLWITYSDNNNSPKVFPGNTDTNTAVKNELAIPVLAKLIKFTPTKYSVHKALRVEVYGIDAKDFSCKSLPVGVASVAKIPDNSMTSSSRYNISTPSSNGRLGYTAGSSWCAATSDSSPYLQVKMSSRYIICGVATQGDHKSDQWVQTYQIQTSTDGSSFTDYKHNNVIKDFAGNTDSDTIVKNMLYEGTVSQYIRINAKSDYGTTSCMRTELYGVQQNTVCSKMSVGLPYSSLVPDHRFSASSFFKSSSPIDKYKPSNARLRLSKAWEPETKKVGDWLQIDLGSVVYVCAVATQGNGHGADEYAKEYKLRISLDNVNWRYYQENNADKVFTGNTDNTNIVTNTLAVPTKTKFLRFYPTEYNHYAAMRVDVYGVPATCSSPFGVEKGGSVKDTKMTSLSQSDSFHAASVGRLYGDASWCSNTSSNTEYIQIDLGKMVTLTGIATQGDHTMHKWVKTYTLKYSIDGSVWNDYREEQPSAKVFQGNSDRTSIVVRWFSHPVTVRYVRVYPQSWNGAICMRIELFGCTFLPTVDGVTAAAQTSQSILVTWQVPSGARCALSGYKVIYSKTPGGVSHEVIVNGGQSTSHTLNKLKKYTNYSITVKAGNDKGYGLASGAVVERTSEDKPDAAPQNFVANAISSKSFHLSWVVPPSDKRNGIIKGYKLWYCKTGHCSSPLAVKTYTGTSTVLGNLDMYTQYTFKLLAFTSVGDGPYTANITNRTLEGPPSVPTVVNTIVIKPDDSTGPKVKIEWNPPSFPNGNIKGYIVSYGKTGNESRTSLGNQTFSFEFDGCGGLSYKINVWAYNSKEGDKGEKSVDINDYVPVQPTKPKVAEYNTTTFNVSFQPLPSTNGRIIVYELEIVKINPKPINKIMINVSCGEVPCRGSANHNCSHTLHHLPQCAKYNITVRAYTTKGAGQYSEEVKLQTSAPGPPRDLEVVKMDKRTAKLKWLQPQPLVGAVKHYTITYYGWKTYDFPLSEFKPNRTASSTSLTTTVTGLYPATRYRFTVSATTECGKGEDSKKAIGDTELEEPPAPKRGNVSTITSAVGNITLWKISDINGKLDHILVYVHKVKDKKRKKRSSDSSKLTCKEIAKYAAELPSNTETFPLGDGKKYGNYTNVKLDEGKQYEVFQCGKTKNLYGGMVKIAEVKVPVGKDNKSSQPPGPNTTLVASLVTVLLILIVGACAAVLFVLWRRHGRRERERSDNMKFQNIAEIAEMEETNDNATSRDVPTHNNDGFVSNGTPLPDDDNDADMYGNAETIRHQPIPANKFSQYVNEKNESLKGEFRLLSNGQLSPYDIAKDPNNKPKNRYQNIITYNHSRVVLEDTDDGSDYINASYIHGFDGTPRTYIATQGPKPLTVPDIWHMIWQENITTIVMLTNLIEAGKIKCHQYWPDHKEQYGQFTVNLHRSDILADYVVRIFIISKDGESGNRQVYHYQYISWPDKGVPQHATSVLGFRRKVKSQYMSSGATAPLLVHCSAGVGRTGAFLAIDAMMERVKKEKSVDIFNYVQLMRNNRSTMIQTDEQYLFVHLALQEAITCGNTEIPVLNLNIALARLSKERPKDRQTGYELEWRRLAAISPKVTEENSEAGRLEQNIPRNRYTDTIPFDAGRVFLSQEQQNYINASFGDAYRERNAFIMTQAPMENTMTDFWHMIHQYKIGSIVMLNKLTEDQQTFPRYWPVQGSDMYDDILVEVVSSSTQGPLVITQCVITHPWEPKSPHNILHIQHTDWPEGGAPSDCQSVLEIVDKVQKSQQQSGNAPIVVHCSDGVGRSGTFCAVYSLLERVKSEQVMDVFQAIKVLRLGRPNAVATLDQYKFCYRMVQIYLDSFNDYANFSEV